MKSFRTATIGMTLALSAFGLAKPPFLKVFMETYKISPDSPLGKAKCLSCHLPPAPPRRSSYGLDVQAAMETAHERMLTAAILKSVEKKDSDKDGFTNLAEIRAGTLPGDPKSKPGKGGKKVALATLPIVALGLGIFLPSRRRKRN